MPLLPDLWQQRFWLPPGTGWDQLDQLGSDGPRPRDLLVALPLALGFTVLRYAFERVVAPPMGRSLGVRDRTCPPPCSSPPLEAFYTQYSRQPSQSDIIGLMSRCDKPQRQVETWFRRRRNQDRPSHAKKFAEASWRFFFYLTAFLSGLSVLLDRAWFWDQRECWRGYPLQRIERAHYWYYQLELSFYLSLLLSVSVDIKRKDFKEQVVHHIATILLLGFSYCSNYVRVGTLVLLLHDASDVLLELGKMFHYGTGWRGVCDCIFIAFTLVFLVTRLLVFPFRIIHTTLVLSMEVFQPFPGYYLFNALLLLLQGLHLFWAGLILRMAYKFLFLGRLDGDERSDQESEGDEGAEREEEEEEEEEEEDGDGRETSEDSLDSKPAAPTNSHAVNNMAVNRQSAAARMRRTR